MKDSSSIRMTISTMNDIEKLKNNPHIKYINLDIENPNLEVIYYLIDHGQNYSYAESYQDTKGYIYVSHDIFKTSQLLIFDLINNIPITLDPLAISRYLYITIGKNLGYDINILPDKNETFNFQSISTINNIWGSLSTTKATNLSFTKLYLYLCRLMNLDCTIISTSQSKYQKNLLKINNREILTDITQDIPYIQAGFKTKNFTGYNDNLTLDEKISYIKGEYNETKIEQLLTNIDYTRKDLFTTILLKTQEIIQASSLKPIELGTIYDLIFKKYCPNYNISIHNLYIKQKLNHKEHFILINYHQKYYGYNYTRNSFVEIAKEEIIKNLEAQKIGIYLNEKIQGLSNIKDPIIA